MKINLISRLLVVGMLASFVVVPIACSSDDGGTTPPPMETPIADPTNAATTIVATSSILADGTATSSVTVTIADTKGTKFTASAGTVALVSTGAASVSAVTDNGDGTYAATVTNSTAETVTISGTLSGTAITDTASITFDPVPVADPTNEKTTIDATGSTLVGGTSTSTVTVQIADTDGNLFTTSGGTVALTATGSASISAVTDNGDGTYTATATGTVEETITISGTLDGVAITDTANITFNPDDSNPAQEATQSTVEVGPSLLRINSGGPEVTFGSVTFLADQYFTTDTRSFTNPFVTEIANTDMDAIYLTERVSELVKSPMSYNIPVTNGTYTVKLYFAEIYWGSENPQGLEGGDGSRVFDILMEGIPIFTGYDLFKDVGAATADTRMYDIEVTDGELTITLDSTVNKCKISAIEVFGNGTIGK